MQIASLNKKVAPDRILGYAIGQGHYQNGVIKKRVEARSNLASVGKIWGELIAVFRAYQIYRPKSSVDNFIGIKILC